MHLVAHPACDAPVQVREVPVPAPRAPLQALQPSSAGTRRWPGVIRHGSVDSGRWEAPGTDRGGDAIQRRTLKVEGALRHRTPGPAGSVAWKRGRQRPGGPRRADDTSLYVEVALDVEGETAVLSVHGEVDAFTAPLLDKIVTAVIDHGAVRLVIDASGVEFMDASGLRVVVSTRKPAAPRRRDTRHPCTIGTSDPAPRDERGRHGRGDRPAVSSASARHHETALTSTLTQVAAIPAAEDMIDATLTAVVVLAAATIAPADGAKPDVGATRTPRHRRSNRRHHLGS